jgi:hypothetical protein
VGEVGESHGEAQKESTTMFVVVLDWTLMRGTCEQDQICEKNTRKHPNKIKAGYKDIIGRLGDEQALWG